jgi:thymidylate synthase (FAD)
MIERIRKVEILKGTGSFEILTPPEILKQQLLIIEEAGRTCYQSVRGPITGETAQKFVKMILRRGHESVIEHSLMTVKFMNVSRGLTHELVRHRIASYSQESTRYVDYAQRGKGPDLGRFQISFVVPPHQDENQQIELKDGRKMSLAQMAGESQMFYRALRLAGWLAEDARQILPIGTKAEIVASANFREWRHIFRMRTAKAAHWEIRRVMGNLLEAVQKLVPVVFDDFVEVGVDKNGLRYFEQRPFE